MLSAKNNFTGVHLDPTISFKVYVIIYFLKSSFTMPEIAYK